VAKIKTENEAMGPSGNLQDLTDVSRVEVGKRIADEILGARKNLRGKILRGDGSCAGNRARNSAAR
jgi:hypothetical protein